MSAADSPFSARPARCVLLLLFGQLGCSPQYQLLQTVDEGGIGGNPTVAGSSSGNEAVGGAMSLGGTDFGGTSVRGGGDSGGSDAGGFTSGGTGSVGGSGPASECSSNADCPSNETCYAGAQCEEGCSEPSCCFGNHCSQPGCGANRPPLCLAFGCSKGESCLAACDATSCECDGADWVCESTTRGAPVASCPQACAPP